MKSFLVALTGLHLGLSLPAGASGKWGATPYAPARVVLGFYLDSPKKTAVCSTGCAR